MIQKEALASIYLLSDGIYDGVITMPIIDISYLYVDIDFSKYDYIIFTSKNSADAIDKCGREWINIPTFCVGEATSKKVINLGGIVKFVANGYGEELLQYIKNHYNKSKFCYIHGERVSTKMDLENIDNYILYKTDCKKIDNIFPKYSKFIFTSPFIANCFFSQVQWDSSYRAISIGNKTSENFPVQVITSDKQTIEECIKIAKSLN